MKCPVCESEGRKSTVTTPGAGMKTAMAVRTYYDEDGRYHQHDPNNFTMRCRCSNGHEFTSVQANRCWCGWTSGEDRLGAVSTPETFKPSPESELPVRVDAETRRRLNL